MSAAPGEDPIGRRLRYPRGFPPEPDDETPWITVVGVAGTRPALRAARVDPAETLRAE